MATTTTNLGLTKPALSESADVGVINDNSDKIDVEAGKSRANFAATYSATSSYAVGAYCERGGNLYRCTTAIASGGEAWNSGHWTQVAVTGEIPKVVDNLTSTSTRNALSAKQGKVLSDEIGTLSSLISTDKSDLVAAINEALGLITRADSPTSGGSSAFTTWCDSISGARLKFFRMRTGVPSSAWNYGPGIIFKMSNDTTLVLLFKLDGSGIATLSKNTTWESPWKSISLS